MWSTRQCKTTRHWSVAQQHLVLLWLHSFAHSVSASERRRLQDSFLCLPKAATTTGVSLGHLPSPSSWGSCKPAVGETILYELKLERGEGTTIPATSLVWKHQNTCFMAWDVVSKVKAGLFAGTPPRTPKDLPLVVPCERIRKEQAHTDSVSGRWAAKCKAAAFSNQWDLPSAMANLSVKW